MARRTRKKAVTTPVESTEVVEVVNQEPEVEDALMDEETQVPAVESEQPMVTETVEEEQPKPKAKAKVKAMVRPQIELSSQADQLKSYLEQYRSLRQVKVATDADRAAIINRFSIIIRHVITHPKTDVLEVMYKFFVDERNNLMSEDTVFQAISKINSEQRIKMETFYTLFNALVRFKLYKEKFSLDLAAVRTILNNDDIINYVAGKLG